MLLNSSDIVAGELRAAAADRRVDVSRRLRHRLLVAQLSAALSGGRAEARPVVRRAHGHAGRELGGGGRDRQAWRARWAWASSPRAWKRVAHAEHLIALGCPHAQGYLFSERAVAAEHRSALLASAFADGSRDAEPYSVRSLTRRTAWSRPFSRITCARGRDGSTFSRRFTRVHRPPDVAGGLDRLGRASATSSGGSTRTGR